MGVFGKLFGGAAPDAAEAERLLAEGRAALWRHACDAAEKALRRAAQGHARPALCRAYLSLARRMRPDAAGALAEARAALALDAACLEAHAALAAALLTNKELPEAGLAYYQVTQLEPHDRDGHVLKLLLVALFAEVMAHAQEDEDGMRLDFVLTPAVRCAVRTLDGRPRMAVDEAPFGEDSAVFAIALGVAHYLAGATAPARAQWARAAESMPHTPTGDSIRRSLALLSAE
jgi:hypothetical protein